MNRRRFAVRSNDRARLDLLALGCMVTSLFRGDRRFISLFRPLRPLPNGLPPFEELWSKFSSYSLLDQFRAQSLLHHLMAAINQPGDIAECGVCRGGTSLFLAHVLRELHSDKRIFMFDSFAGLPKPDRRFDKYYRAKDMKADYDAVLELIDRHKLSDYCVVKKGWFSKTFRSLRPSHKFCFVHIDCDLYEPGLHCLRTFYPRLGYGCPIVFDDYYDGSGGMQAAVNCWLEKTREVVFLGPAPQATILKGVTTRRAGARYFTARGEHSPRFSVDRLKTCAEYRRFLFETHAIIAQMSAEIGTFVTLMEGNLGDRPNLTSQTLEPISRIVTGTFDSSPG